MHRGRQENYEGHGHVWRDGVEEAHEDHKFEGIRHQRWDFGPHNIVHGHWLFTQTHRRHTHSLSHATPLSRTQTSHGLVRRVSGVDQLGHLCHLCGLAHAFLVEPSHLLSSSEDSKAHLRYAHSQDLEDTHH